MVSGISFRLTVSEESEPDFDLPVALQPPGEGLRLQMFCRFSLLPILKVLRNVLVNSQ
jgi:hypothetical protein